MHRTWVLQEAQLLLLSIKVLCIKICITKHVIRINRDKVAMAYLMFENLHWLRYFVYPKGCGDGTKISPLYFCADIVADKVQPTHFLMSNVNQFESQLQSVRLIGQYIYVIWKLSPLIAVQWSFWIVEVYICIHRPWSFFAPIPKKAFPGHDVFFIVNNNALLEERKWPQHGEKLNKLYVKNIPTIQKYFFLNKILGYYQVSFIK